MVYQYTRKAEVLAVIFVLGIIFLLLASIINQILDGVNALVLAGIIVGHLSVAAYVNIKVILPRYFHRQRFFSYAVFVVILLAITTFSISFVAGWYLLNEGFAPPVSRRGYANTVAPVFKYFFLLPPSFFLTIVALFVSTVYAMAKKWVASERKSANLTKEKMDHELKFLRSQINPHFLFNALNNLHATVQLYPHKAEDYILSLGTMLRYVLEDCCKESVSLQSELNYIKNYIFFQQQRDAELKHVDLKIEGAGFEDFMIEPMLLIPLVENAFMHSRVKVGDKTLRYVSILVILRQEMLFIRVTNNMPTVSELPATKDFLIREDSIGISNIRRRLELLYPESHIFKYGPVDGDYMADLTIVN